MKNAKKHARAEEAGMLKCRKREKACQNRRSRHAKMRKMRKSMPGAEEAGMLKCEKREKACRKQKKQVKVDEIIAGNM